MALRTVTMWVKLVHFSDANEVLHTLRPSRPRFSSPIPLLFFGGGDESLEDGSKFNPLAISFIRDNWIFKQMHDRESEYTEYRALRVLVATWNVNGKFPQRDDLTPWLCEGADADSEQRLTLPDIYVIGLQEMVDLSAANVALGTQSAKRSAQWQAHLEKLLNSVAPSPDDSYECIATRYLVGVLICVFVKVRHQPHVSNVQDAVAPVGVMGVMGNKGGAAIRFRVYDSSMCFVCAHLAAHQNAVAERNSDFANIMAKTEFRDDARSEAAAVARGAAASAEVGTFGILDHDYIVWFGDFNYRIVETVSTERCFEQAKGSAADLEELRQQDQLNIERAAGRSFLGFTEGPLTFPPTYKFQPGTDAYEQRPEKKLRAPAWCDRILWRCGEGVDPRHLRQLYYGCASELKLSDHKPVHAVFDVCAKTTVEARRAAVSTDITRQLDSMENRTLPKVRISHEAVQFSDVIYASPAQRTLTIENIGQVAALWRFVPKPEEKVFSTTWLTVDPPFCMVPPGETVTVTLTVTVDDAVARDISLGREVAFSSSTASGGSVAGGLLEEFLVLRVERGRDYYLPVVAAVLPTAFGCSLAQLARRPEPVRALGLTTTATAAMNAVAGVALGSVPRATNAAAAVLAAGGAPSQVAAAAARESGPAPDLSAGSHRLAELLAEDESDDGGAPLHPGDSSRKGSMVLSVPKEVWRLVDALYRRGMDTRGIFQAPGSPAEAAAIREALDTGDPLPASADPRSVAQVLLDLLSSLREPVLPTSCFPGAELGRGSAPVEPWCAQVLRSMAPLHYNVLIYLLRFAREVLAHASSNGCSLEGLAYVLSRALMRGASHDTAAAHAATPAFLGGGAAPAAASGGPAGSHAGPGAGASAAAAAAASDEKAGASLALASPFSDRGTRWEPSGEEQESMTRIFSYLLQPSTSLV